MALSQNGRPVSPNRYWLRPANASQSGHCISTCQKHLSFTALLTLFMQFTDGPWSPPSFSQGPRGRTGRSHPFLTHFRGFSSSQIPQRGHSVPFFSFVPPFLPGENRRAKQGEKWWRESDRERVRENKSFSTLLTTTSVVTCCVPCTRVKVYGDCTGLANGKMPRRRPEAAMHTHSRQFNCVSCHLYGLARAWNNVSVASMGSMHTHSRQFNCVSCHLYGLARAI